MNNDETILINIDKLRLTSHNTIKICLNKLIQVYYINNLYLFINHNENDFLTGIR